MESRLSLITLGVSSLERSYQFYTELGFPTSSNPDDNVIFFKTSGTRLALYPFEKLLEDISHGLSITNPGFSGITIAHNTREKSEVDSILEKAESIGAKILKPAQDVFWGGYSGYFADPDGYVWEIAYADLWEFNDDGSLILK